MRQYKRGNILKGEPRITYLIKSTGRKIMYQYQVTLQIIGKAQYSGIFRFPSLARAVEKVKNNLYAEPTRMGAKLAIQESGRADYWDSEQNHATITKI
mgnify:CR=1 FL=1